MSPPRTARLHLSADGVSVDVTAESPVTMSPQSIARSKLLQELLSDGGSSGHAPLPLTEDALLLWLEHAPTCHGQDSLKDAADVLIDEATTADSAALLAQLLVQEQNMPGERPSVQVIGQLPAHLIQAVLSHAPLHHCLLHLPDTWHSNAISAHYPCIDAHHSLHLRHLTPAAMPPALAATATFSTLSDLSLAGLTLPQDPPPSFAPLTKLHALASLSLTNTGLSDTSAAALAAALPSLRHLASLDLSHNLIPALAMQSLAPALACCAGLRSLDLAHTMPFTDSGYSSLDELAHSIPSLQLLTCLSLGGRSKMPASCLGYSLSAALSHLLKALGCISTLQQLALDFSFTVPVDRAGTLADALATLQQLRDLRFTVPAVRELAGEVDMQAWAEVGPDPDACLVFSRAIGSLSALSAIELSYDSNHDQLDPLVVHLSGLSPLTALQRLSLRRILGLHGVDPVCVQHLTALALLTSFHVYIDRASTVHVPVLAAAAETACALPHLRSLHMPLPTVPTAHERLLPALLRFSRRGRLTLDLEARHEGLISVPYDVTPFAPLVQHAQTLCVSAVEGEWLRPLVPAIAAHSTLRSMRVRALGVPQQGALLDVVDATAALSSLCCLDVCIAGGEGGMGPALLGRLQACTALTELRLTHCRTELGDYEAPPWLAPGFAVLRGLHRVGLGVYDAAAHSECVAALAQLTLHTLTVSLARQEDAPLLGELLGHLPHLRSLQVGGIAGVDAIADMQRAAAALPACHYANFDSCRLGGV